LGSNPVTFEVYNPSPEPSNVRESAIVGVRMADQQTPRAVTGAPPSAEIMPPLIKVVAVIDAAGVVTSVDKEGESTAVVKEICCPYEVPAAFVAYALT
jgi:hypothetical protein